MLHATKLIPSCDQRAPRQGTSIRLELDPPTRAGAQHKLRSMPALEWRPWGATPYSLRQVTCTTSPNTEISVPYRVTSALDPRHYANREIE